MKFAIVSSYDHNMDSVAAVTMPVIRAYCERHGYEHLTYRESGVWGRVNALQQALDLCDWAFLLDADAVILNHEVALESFTEGVDCVLTRDHNGLNAGALLVRSCDWSRRFVEALQSRGDHFRRYPNAEQIGLAHLIVCEDCRHWRVVPQRRLNSYRGAWYGVDFGEEGEYQEGDFILHAAALPNATRVRLLQEAIECRVILG